MIDLRDPEWNRRHGAPPSPPCGERAHPCTVGARACRGAGPGRARSGGGGVASPGPRPAACPSAPRPDRGGPDIGSGRVRGGVFEHRRDRGGLDASRGRSVSSLPRTTDTTTAGTMRPGARRGDPAALPALWAVRSQAEPDVGLAWIIHGVATRGPTRYGRGA
jgi:hypothetical protein